MNFFQIKSYLTYCLKSRYRKGYGLHSPFVFNLVREVVYCKHGFYAFKEIDVCRNKLKQSTVCFEAVDYGSGSQCFSGKKRRVCALVKHSSIAPKYGELLFRLVHYLNPASIVELGTSVGISTSYLALADRRREVHTIEGCPETARVAQETFSRLKCQNVKQYVGQFKDVLPDMLERAHSLDFVFFDGHHDKQATIDYFNICLRKVNNDSVFVFDDIHWSQGMEEAWKIICDHPQITVSIDLFQLGIVFFKKECQKQHFIVRY
ncbi:O-methyltransferase [Carboxylicivirga taeanensis]|uniref:O-methyltransferase n=1 Tax=Carboxylicivirga taeanensis TaxID=1416875 RepID=UPI003F6DDA1C